MQRMLPPTVGLKCGGASFSGPRPVTCSRAVGVAWQRLPRALSTGPRPRHNRAKHTPRRPKEPQARGSVQIPGSGIRFRFGGVAPGPRPTPRRTNRSPIAIYRSDPVDINSFLPFKRSSTRMFQGGHAAARPHICVRGGMCDLGPGPAHVPTVTWAPAPPMVPSHISLISHMWSLAFSCPHTRRQGW